MILSALIGCLLSVQSHRIDVPAFTAFIEPDPEAARVSEQHGIRGWTDGKQSINWFGEFKKTGKINVSLVVNVSARQIVKWRMTVGGKQVIRQLAGVGKDNIIDFGDFTIDKPGYQRIRLEGIYKTDKDYGDIRSIRIEGPAVEEAHFSLVERRNAASVHLGYPIPEGQKVAAFYCEVVPIEDPIWTYYCATGWHRGYFGFQVNSPTERRIIFSVWDSGNEAVDRDKVKDEDRVRLIAKGPDVYSGDFGNEGTGGHSHLKYMWKTGELQRFLVVAKPDDATHTTFAGYYYFNDKKQWGLISSWRAPKDGGYMRGLYSFNENFGGANGELRRFAEFGNQWIMTSEGKWIELTKARFTHDGHGKKDRLDYDAGVKDGRFFLSNGGFLPGTRKYGDEMVRPATITPPTDLPKM